MRRNRVVSVVAAAVAVGIGLVGVQTGTAGAAVAPRTLYYDASQAAEFKANVTQAVAVWNSSVKSVQLKAGSPASITIVAFDGWPYAEPRGLGKGSVHLGREAVNEGFDKTRITAHELGHILGLPDNRTGLCSDLMSGHSAPTSCTNAHPSAREAAQVERNFRGRFNAATLPARFTDCFQTLAGTHSHG
jgi:snapalysin